jgi:nucleoside-diphosphate-sugar epimerase
MKILVTGANGFVGSAVCRRLLAEGWQVFGAVRRDVRLPAGIETRRIDSIGPHTLWQETLTGMDAVVHLAARVHVMKDRATDPLTEFRHANSEGTLRLARSAAHLGVHRFLFMSSVKVNGEATFGNRFSESDTPTPRDPYGQSKWEAEQGLRRLADSEAMHSTILRPPLVYGPGVGGNFRSLLNAVAAGWPLPFAAVNNRRSLINVENLADAVATALREPGGRCETFLVKDGEDVSTAELIRRIAQAMGRPVRLLPVPLTLLRGLGGLLGKRDVIDRVIGSLQIDDQGFRRRFGWTPPLTLNSGLATTVEWYKNLTPRSGR